MYRHILIASDGSELAQKAVDQGLALAKALNSKVLVVTVTEPLAMVAPGEVALAFPIDEYEKGVAATAAEVLSAVEVAAQAAGVPCETLHMKDRYPAEGIVEAAGERGCDLIVMSSHGRRGLGRLVLGSQANEVVTHSTMPVLICR